MFRLPQLFGYPFEKLCLPEMFRAIEDFYNIVCGISSSGKQTEDRFLAKSKQVQGENLYFVKSNNDKTFKIRTFGLSTANCVVFKP
jgi:hypothetical protein